MAWASQKATSSSGVHPTESCWPGDPLAGRSGEALSGCHPREWDTYLSRRRLRFTLSALAIALAPATPMEFPRKLWMKAGGEEGQPRTAACCLWAGGGVGRGGPTPTSQGTGNQVW